MRSRFGERASGAAVVAAVEKLMHPAPAVPSDREQETSPPSSDEVPPAQEKRAPRGPQKRQARSVSRRRVTIADLTAAGLLPEGAPIDAQVEGVTHPARIRDGQIEWNGQLFDSPSAASRALRNTQSWNGWVDWRFRGEKLADLRNWLPMQEEPSGQQGGT